MYTANVRLNGNLFIGTSVDTEQELFKSMSRIQETFQKNCSRCGKCGNEDIRFVCRQDKEENDWYEVVCNDFKCKAKLVFGCTKGKGGVLFPKVKWDNLSKTQQGTRADEKEHAEAHHGYLPNGGWFVYKASDES